MASSDLPPRALDVETYERELRMLQVRLVKMHEWIAEAGLRIVVLFEGRDAAGKGGVIKRITQFLNPRIVRIAALAKPTEREKTQWYFQRYVEHLPSAGEMVLFDRSWYNRAGVERVMGFCTEEDLEVFFDSVLEFERLLRLDGIILIKYWFSVSDEEQEARFRARLNKRRKRWKLSEMDIASWERWEDYSDAKDEMFERTDTDESPWWVVESDDKLRARLNCMAHLLSMIPYERVVYPEVELPPRPPARHHARPPYSNQRLVPELY